MNKKTTKRKKRIPNKIIITSKKRKYRKNINKNKDVAKYAKIGEQLAPRQKRKYTKRKPSPIKFKTNWIDETAKYSKIAENILNSKPKKIKPKTKRQPRKITRYTKNITFKEAQQLEQEYLDFVIKNSVGDVPADILWKEYQNGNFSVFNQSQLKVLWEIDKAGLTLVEFEAEYSEDYLRLFGNN